MSRKPVYTVSIYLDSGQTIVAKFREFTTTRGPNGLSKIKWELADGSQILHLDVDRVVAVVSK